MRQRSAPIWPVGDFARPAVDLSSRPDGSFVIRSRHTLDANLPLAIERLACWAERAPERVFLAECRNGSIVRRVTYQQTQDLTQRIATAIARSAASEARPVLIVARNGIDNALLRLASMRAAVPFAPLSPVLMQTAGARRRLATVLNSLSPAFAYVEEPEAFREAVGPMAKNLVLVGPDNIAATSGVFSDLLAIADPDLVRRREAAVSPDTLAAIFFTSGSSGAPKGVLTTQRMVSANQEAIAILWPFLRREPPVILDWLPWHHTFGGNDNFHKALWHGGTLFIDDGRPTAEGIGHSIANLQATRPTLHFNVPRGLDLLLDVFERNPVAREAFLDRLRLIFVAGAGLSRTTWERLRNLLDRQAAATGRETTVVSGWGATEAGSTICIGHFPIDRPDNVGLPLPGFKLKLVPAGAKFEARIRGPNVTPGYWGRPDLTEVAFDEEGYYRTGDAVRLVDSAQPEAGLMFDGRVAEDFKLSTGTWISVGPLRLALLGALGPFCRDVAIAGHGSDFLGALIFLDVAACRHACGLDRRVDSAAIARTPELTARILAVLQRHNELNAGSSTRIARAILVAEPPSAEEGEINDKGYLNQTVALARRADLVRRLFSKLSPDGVICP